MERDATYAGEPEDIFEPNEADATVPLAAAEPPAAEATPTEVPPTSGSQPSKRMGKGRASAGGMTPSQPIHITVEGVLVVDLNDDLWHLYANEAGRPTLRREGGSR